MHIRLSLEMSVPGEQVPSAEAKIVSNDIEEAALTVKEAKDTTEKAPVSNYWVWLSLENHVFTADCH